MRISGISSIQKVGAFGFAVENEDLDSTIERVEDNFG